MESSVKGGAHSQKNGHPTEKISYSFKKSDLGTCVI